MTVVDPTMLRAREALDPARAMVRAQRVERESVRRDLWRLLVGCLVALALVGLGRTALDDVRIAGASSPSARAHVVYCHSSPDALAWCEWVEFMQDPANAAWFEWATAPKVPALLRRIAWCEAGAYLGLPRYQTNYRALNQQGSTASGGYQILDGTWAVWRTYVAGAEQYARAVHAPAHVQDAVAVAAYHRHGTTPWNASRSCWS